MTLSGNSNKLQVNLINLSSLIRLIRLLIYDLGKGWILYKDLLVLRKMTPKVIVRGESNGLIRSPSLTGLSSLSKKLSCQESNIESLKQENELAKDMLMKQNEMINAYHEELLAQQTLIDVATDQITKQTAFITRAEQLLTAHENALSDIING
jgi:hypothetical protein